MQLGILTAPFEATPLNQVADYAASAGFQSLELPAGPPPGSRNAAMPAQRTSPLRP